MKQRPAFLSIVVPVLNEAGLIGGLLRYLRTFGAGLEIIVVDGGSSDATLSTAQPLADRVITAPRGREPQRNAGGESATRAHAAPRGRDRQVAGRSTESQ